MTLSIVVYTFQIYTSTAQLPHDWDYYYSKQHIPLKAYFRNCWKIQHQTICSLFIGVLKELIWLKIYHNL
jgi:hypothetical protein